MSAVASRLILSSGENSLRSMYEVEQGFSAREFIRFAFERQEGQFSYTRHTVALVNGELAGIASHWLNTMTASCRKATVDTLVAYFGAILVPEIVQRSVLLQSIIPAPKPDGLGVGHIAVVEKFWRQGVARALLRHLANVGQDLGKTQLELDVECSNLAAISLYEKTGFTQLATNRPGKRAAELGFSAHHHMQKVIGA